MSLMGKQLLPLFFVFILLLQVAYPVAVWKKSTGESTISFSLCTDSAYLGFSDGVVSDFQASTGIEQWSVTLPDGQVPSALACDESYVYAGTKTGSIFRIGAGTGGIAALMNLTANSSGYVTSLTMVPPYIFASSYGAYLINPVSRTIRWSYPVSSISSPLGFSQSAAFFEANGTLYGLDANTGSLLWQTATNPTFLSAPYYSQNRIYLGETSNSLHAFDSLSGNELWNFETSGWVSSTPISYLDMIFFGSNDHYVYAVSLNGSLVWKFKTGEAVQSKMQIISGKNGEKLLAFSSNDGYFYLVDPAGGSLSLRTQTGGPSRFFAPVEGGIFVASDDGQIGVYSLESGCNFDSPAQGEYVNKALVHVYGTAFSTSGVSNVQVRVNDGPWDTATGAAKWSYSFDPGDIVPGPFTVDCRVVDSTGKVETGVYSSLDLVKSSLAQPGKMQARFDPWYITSPQAVTLVVTDDAGSPIQGATVTFEGQTYTTTGKPLQLTPAMHGQERAVVDKDGYEETQAIFYNLTSDNSGSLVVAGLVVLALAAVYLLFLRKRSSRAPASK